MVINSIIIKYISDFGVYFGEIKTNYFQKFLSRNPLYKELKDVIFFKAVEYITRLLYFEHEKLNKLKFEIIEKVALKKKLCFTIIFMDKIRYIKSYSEKTEGKCFNIYLIIITNY